MYDTSGEDYIEIRGGSEGMKIINLTATFGAGNEPTANTHYLLRLRGGEAEPTGRVRVLIKG